MKKKLKAAKRYYEKGTGLADQTVKGFIRDKGAIVHGGRAMNAYLPDYLDRPARDWDIAVSDDAKGAAKALEQLLDERYGGNYFEVKPSRHPGTFKVVSLVTTLPVADITVPEYSVSFEKLADGINYATLDHHIQRIKVILDDPAKMYRWGKDKEALQRIEIHRETQKQYDIGIDQLPEVF